MKRSKQTFLLMLLLANFFILLHSAMPHVHHDGIICMASKEMGFVFSDVDCDDYECCWNHVEDENSKHKHTATEECDIYSLLKRSQVKADGNQIFDFIAQQSLFHTTLLSEHTACFCFSSLDLERKPISTHYVNTYVNPSVGSTFSLRAPPTDVLV